MSIAKALIHYAENWTLEELREVMEDTNDHNFLTAEDRRELLHFYSWMLRRKQLTNIRSISPSQDKIPWGGIHKSVIITRSD